MSTQPTLSMPAWFSNAACSIVNAKRPLWQYELLGQIFSDAVDQVASIDPPFAGEQMPDAATFDTFGFYCLGFVERLANNLESMNPVITREVDTVANGGMHMFGDVAAKMGESYLQAKQMVQEAKRLPVHCEGMIPRSAWRRELEGYMVKIKEDLCDMASQGMLIHESIGESILARVRQAQKRVQDGEDCVLDLNLRFSFEADMFNEHLQDFIDCMDAMERAIEARHQVNKAAINYGVPRAGRIYLHQSLTNPDLVTVTVKLDGEGSAALTSRWKMLQSYVCIREVQVCDLRRAEACVRSLMDAHQSTSLPTAYQIPAAKASELIYRVAQLYSFPSMT